MAIFNENQILDDAVLSVARKIVVAARTAPKTRGKDNLLSAILTGSEMINLAEKMKDMGEKLDNHIFLRDGQNIIDGAKAVVILGCKINPAELKLCSLCGFENCDEKRKYPETPCAFNTIDLGIAVGSAVSVAANNRVDNRLMYTIGMAAKELGLLGGECNVILGIPLSASAKNPFFDRK